MPSESEERDGCRNIADSKRVHLRKQKRQKEASPQFPFGGDVSDLLPMRSIGRLFRGFDAALADLMQRTPWRFWTGATKLN
jgi:hypothetical protein